jgi:polyphosphate kinase
VQKGGPALITCKMNALTDPRFIESLYEASQAGLRIDLIIRGCCCLRPGLEGISENIWVVSLVGRFLEHTRAFAFGEGEEEEIYLGSTDLMQRNLDRRVQQVFPLREARDRDKVRRLLEPQLADTVNAWELKPDGFVARLHPRGDGEPPDSQALSCSKRGFSAGERLPNPVYLLCVWPRAFPRCVVPCARGVSAGGRRSSSRRIT